MLGSGTPEVNELAVLLRYILSVLNKYQRNILVPTELYDLMSTINAALDTLKSAYTDSLTLYPKVPAKLFQYWDRVASAREEYRKATKVTFSGSTTNISHHAVKATLERWLEELEIGSKRAYKLGTHGVGDNGATGIIPTYVSVFVEFLKTELDQTSTNSCFNTLIAQSVFVQCHQVDRNG